MSIRYVLDAVGEMSKKIRIELLGKNEQTTLGKLAKQRFVPLRKRAMLRVVMFQLMLNLPVNILVMMGRFPVFLSLTSTNQRIMCLTQ